MRAAGDNRAMTGSFLFWGTMAAMAALAMAFVLPGLVRPAAPRRDASRAALNAAVYRSQLADLDRDLAAGLLRPAEHAAAADDLQRRLLDEARSEPTAASARPARGVALAVGGLLPIAALAMYLAVGHPEVAGEASTAAFDDARPFETRADAEAFVTQLEAHVAKAPRDARAWALLGRLRLALDQFDASAAAFERAVALSPKVAADPMVWCEYADAVGMAQGGVLAGKPRTLIDRALALRADHPRALEMAGSAEFEAGHYAQALFFWERLLPQLDAASDAHRELQAAITRTRMRAGMG
jgi:cytochrome c-type biogenesis protein CcmH